MLCGRWMVMPVSWLADNGYEPIWLGKTAFFVGGGVLFVACLVGGVEVAGRPAASLVGPTWIAGSFLLTIVAARGLRCKQCGARLYLASLTGLLGPVELVALEACPCCEEDGPAAARRAALVLNRRASLRTGLVVGAFVLMNVGLWFWSGYVSGDYK